MDDHQGQVGAELRKAMDEMRALRDEARLKLHLASMDARSAWNRMEPEIEAAERDASRATANALQKVEGAVKKLRSLVASL